MKNTVGQVPRGDNFFPREDLITKIYQRLDANAHLYLAAPRRMGKTAIMRHLEDQPRTGYEFHYLITESIYDPVVYLNELAKTLQSFRTWSQMTIQFIKNLPKLRLSIPGSESELGLVWNQDDDPFAKFKDFVSQLKTNGNKIVVMIDEFPQTIANISRKHGPDTARQFLQFNREIRQLANQNLRFIITGSMGLYAIAEKLDAIATLNDLTTLEIPPLSKSQTTALVTQLLDEASVNYPPETVDELLRRIVSFHPFYLQLAVQELIDEFESTGRTIDTPAVERAFNKILHRRNDNYFEHYYQRLKTLPDKDFQLALAILNALAEPEHGLNSEQIQELATQHAVTHPDFVLRSLEFDGYLFGSKIAGETIYRFTSPILRKWWQMSVVGSAKPSLPPPQRNTSQTPLNLLSSAFEAAWKQWERKYGH